jgi:4-amino-4-deoxy-L-arabinose transferase-like glycosyltransferase
VKVPSAVTSLPAAPSASRGERGWLAALTGVAFAVRFVGLGRQGLWFDETVSVFVARMDWREGINFLLADGVHPPLYYAVQKALLAFGSSEAALRLPAAVFGALAVPLLYRTASRWAPQARITAALLLALSPLAVWYSREARMYSLLMLLTLAAMALYGNLLLNPRPSGRLSSAFAVVHALAYLTHFFGGMLFIIQLVHLAFTLRRHAAVLRRWTVLQAMAFIPLAAWTALLATRSGRYFGIGWIPAPVWRDPLLTMVNFSAGYSPPLTGLHWAAAALLLGLTLLGLRAAWRAPSLALLAGLWAFLPIGLGLLFSVARPLYVDRFFLGSLPPFLLLAAQGLSVVPGRLRLTTAALTVALMAWGLYRLDFGPGPVKEEWREAGAYLSVARADEIVVPRVLQIVVPLSLYYRGEAPVQALEVNRDVASLSKVAGDSSGVWLVYWNASADAHSLAPRQGFDPSTETNPEAASWVVGEAAILLERRDFVGVTLFHLKPPATP